MRTKDEAFEKFKEYKSLVEDQKDKKIKILWSDKGEEYIFEAFSLLYAEHGIIHKKTPCMPRHIELDRSKIKFGPL